MRLFPRTVLLLGLIFFWVSHWSSAAPGNWAVYYSDKASYQSLQSYEVLVLDSESHPPLGPLLEEGKLLFGYLSLGEVRSDQRYFAELKAAGLLLGENERWKGSHFIDMRHPDWAVRVIEEIVPWIMRKGFGGLFLDTLDDAAHLERLDPVEHAGMVEAAAALVRTIRRHYPSILIMLNRAYEILPRVEGDIDILLGESIYTAYDFDRRTYGRVREELFDEQVRMLKAVKARRPDLRVFTLDYWSPEDEEGIAAIYRVQRAHGFEPYVATILLDRLVSEPQR